MFCESYVLIKDLKSPLMLLWVRGELWKSLSDAEALVAAVQELASSAAGQLF